MKYLEEKYGLVEEYDKNAMLSITLSSLADSKKADDFVTEVQAILNTNERMVAGTHLCSWIGALCAGFHAALSLDDKVLQMNSEHIVFQIMMEQGKRKIKFVLEELSFTNTSIRSDERNIEINSFYLNSIAPFIHAVSLSTGVKHAVLWTQFVTRLYNEQDLWLDLYFKDTHRCNKIKLDFMHLFHDLPLEQLQLKRNPFDVTFKWISHATNATEMIRQRSTCCFAYKTGMDKGYCYSCPQMTEEERQLRRV